MDPLNQKIIIQNSNPLSMEQFPSTPQPLKINLFTKNAKSLTQPLSTNKKTIAQWIPTTTKTLIAAGIIPLSYLTYQYLTKSALPKVTVNPFSLFEPITTALKVLFPIGVVIVGTKLVISKSYDRHDKNLKDKSLIPNSAKKSDFKIEKKEYNKETTNENLSIEKQTELLLSNSSSQDSGFDQKFLKRFESNINSMLKDGRNSEAFKFTKKLIEINPDAASSIISLIAKNHLQEVYPLIEPILLRNDISDDHFLEKALQDVMESLNLYITQFFSEENSQTNKISLQQILNIIQPYMPIDHNCFADGFYSKFIKTYPLSSWNLATHCIEDKFFVDHIIITEAIGNLFITHKDDNSASAASKFAICWIQKQLEIVKDYSKSVNLLTLYSNLCDKTKLEETINNQLNQNLEEDVLKISKALMFIAMENHRQSDLLPLLGEEYMDSSEENDSDLILDRNDTSTKTITNSGKI